MAISIAIAFIRSRTIFDIYAKEQKYYNTLLDQQNKVNMQVVTIEG